MDLKLGDTRLIIDACKERGLLRNQAAYVLATAYHETAHTMKPVREMGGEKYLKAKKYYPYVGMGYVQLTWLANYKKAGKKLGVDFVKAPRKLLEARYAAPILVIGMDEGWFTGKKLSDYITLNRSDFGGARRIINGTDRAQLIADIAFRYDALLMADGYGNPSATQPAPQPRRHPPVPELRPKPEPPPAPPQDGVRPDVVLVDGKQEGETQVIVVQHPDNPPAAAPVPSSKTGFAALAAIISAIAVAAYNYFVGG